MSTHFLDFGLYFGSILVQSWLQKPILFEAKIALICSLSFEASLAVFWEPDFTIVASTIVPESEKAILWKWASRLHEVLIFKDLGPQNPSKHQ